MQFYWKCDECDETNLYPTIKVCETCGTPMSSAAEQRVLQEIKDEEKRQAQIKKEQERRRREAERARQEAERKRREAEIAAKKAEEERIRIAKLEQALKRREEREKKFGSIFERACRIASNYSRALAGIAVAVTLVFLFYHSKTVSFDYMFKDISNNIQSEYMVHTVVKPVETDNEVDGKTEEVQVDEGDISYEELSSEKRTPRTFLKIESLFETLTDKPGENISKQTEFIKSNFKPGENISDLIKNIVEFFSGGAVDDNV